MTQIASVSLHRPLEDMAEELGRSFEEYGFAIVRDHGIPHETIARAEEASRAFFALPDEVKRQYKLPGMGGARGYTPFGIERAKDAKVHDLKEFWHVGRDLPAGDPLEAFMPPNVWPDEIAGFRETFSQLFAAFDATGAKILSGVARHLGLDPHWFDAKIDEGNSILRLLHYPPVSASAVSG